MGSVDAQGDPAGDRPALDAAVSVGAPVGSGGRSLHAAGAVAALRMTPASTLYWQHDQSIRPRSRLRVLVRSLRTRMHLRSPWPEAAGRRSGAGSTCCP